MPTDLEQPALPSPLEPIDESTTVHHERAAKRRPKTTGVQQLNLVSLLDVTFLLLIFFVLTASFAPGEGLLPADLPRGHNPPKPTENPITPLTIQVSTRGLDSFEIIYEVIGSRVATEPEQLFEILLQLQRNDHNPRGIFLQEDPVVIQPSQDVPWGNVVEAFNQARRAKYRDINFAPARKS